MAKEGNNIFWQFVDFYLRDDAPSESSTDSEQYDFILKRMESSNLISDARKILLKISLSVRQYNPKVEMYRHLMELANQRNKNNCQKSGWIVYNSQIFCDYNSFENSFQSEEEM